MRGPGSAQRPGKAEVSGRALSLLPAGGHAAIHVFRRDEPHRPGHGDSRRPAHHQGLLRPRRRLGPGQRVDLHRAEALRLLADAARLHGPGARLGQECGRRRGEEPAIRPGEGLRSAGDSCGRRDGLALLSARRLAERGRYGRRARRAETALEREPRRDAPRDDRQGLAREPVRPWADHRPGGRGRVGVCGPARRPSGRGGRAENGASPLADHGRRARGHAADDPPRTVPLRHPQRLGLLPPRGRRPDGLAAPCGSHGGANRRLRTDRIALAGAGERADRRRRGLFRRGPSTAGRRRHSHRRDGTQRRSG